MAEPRSATVKYSCNDVKHRRSNNSSGSLRVVDGYYQETVKCPDCEEKDKRRPKFISRLVGVLSPRKKSTKSHTSSTSQKEGRKDKNESSSISQQLQSSGGTSLRSDLSNGPTLYGSENKYEDDQYVALAIKPKLASRNDSSPEERYKRHVAPCTSAQRERAIDPYDPLGIRNYPSGPTMTVLPSHARRSNSTAVKQRPKKTGPHIMTQQFAKELSHEQQVLQARLNAIDTIDFAVEPNPTGAFSSIDVQSRNSSRLNGNGRSQLHDIEDEEEEHPTSDRYEIPYDARN